MRIDLLNLTYDELKKLVADSGMPQYRADQIYSWVSKGVAVENMTDLSKKLRDDISRAGWYASLPEIVNKLVSQIDGTVKYLFKLSDGQLIESVVMKYKYGNTICVSSQCGCRMGCRFCASTINGLDRSLEASEILGQVIAASNDIGERISNIVMMGIGEPFDNYGNVVRFLRLVSAEKGLNISPRHISVSTCGVVDGIKKLMNENLPVTLSISLHNVNTEQRKQIMPVTNKWSVEELLAACRDYFVKTGRRISFEYTLILNENDSVRHAEELASGLRKYLGKMPIHVNLIPLNNVPERSFKRSSSDRIEAFRNKLVSLGINATVRRRLGPDINASCGQLRYNGQA